MEGWVELVGWLVIYLDGLPVRRQVTHPSSNQARRTATTDDRGQRVNHY